MGIVQPGLPACPGRVKRGVSGRPRNNWLAGVAVGAVDENLLIDAESVLPFRYDFAADARSGCTVRRRGR